MTHLHQVSGVAVAMLVVACDGASPPAATSPAGPATQTGNASFYGREFAGRETASGERLRLGAMTAASRTLPIGTRVQVVNTETGQSARVRINDRGPYVGGRVLDLTPAAARRVGLEEEDGVARVSVRPVPSPYQCSLTAGAADRRSREASASAPVRAQPNSSTRCAR